jgi:hypothetical protein
MVAMALLPAPSFYVDEDVLERVTKFRYLRRILSKDDHDLSAYMYGPVARWCTWFTTRCQARYML